MNLLEVAMELRPDGTSDCDTCHMPMFPVALIEDTATLECANRHRATIEMPDDPKLRRFVRNWVARKGAQLEQQHRRWEMTDEDN